MGKIEIKDHICRPFCMFFREGEKEEMECYGAIIIEKLITAERLQISDLPSSGKEPDLWKNKELTLEPVCDGCSFKSEDCDYQSLSPPENCEPCGGYILLSILRKNNMIQPEDITEILGE